MLDVLGSFLPLIKGEVRWGLNDEKDNPPLAPPFIREGNAQNKTR